MRDKIPDELIAAIWANYGSLGPAKAVLIAALPDMVKPLEWVRIDPVTEGCTSILGNDYTVWAMDGHGYCKLPNTPAGEKFKGGAQAAKAAAQAHHVAQSLAPFGITPPSTKDSS